MADEMTPEQMLEVQKENCLFCKIVKGEVDSKKVYEDDKMLVILDINPAHKGHVLVMPKEHYPILPLVPPETIRHLFQTSKKLMTAMRSSLIVPRVTMLVANGGAAGQRSPHFLYHLIPREDGDGLDHLDLQKLIVKQEVPDKTKQAITQLMQKLMPSKPSQFVPATPVSRVPSAAPQTMTSTPSESEPGQPITDVQDVKAQLAQMLEMNPQLKALIKHDPKQVIEYVQKSPELSVLFEGVDITALSQKLQLADASETGPTIVDAEPEMQPDTNDIPDAAMMNDKELLAYLDQKPQLKQLLLTRPAELEAMAKTNPRVAAFFRTIPVAALAARIKTLIHEVEIPVQESAPVPEHAQSVAEETDDSVDDSDDEGVDFDALSSYLQGGK